MPRRSADPRRKPLSPLDYLLGIVNDPGADLARRDKAAIAAAPYVHPRADTVPKKAQQAEQAKEAGGKHSEWADDLQIDGGLQRQ